jgi:hypothetical protein
MRLTGLPVKCDRFRSGLTRRYTRPHMRRPGGLDMQDTDDLESVLMSLLAQVQRSLAPIELQEVDQLVTTGSHRLAVEAVCRFANAGRHPLPMQARAMVFKLADRLGMDPEALGMLD